MAQCSARTGIPVAGLREAKGAGAPGFVGSKVDLAALVPWVFGPEGGRVGKAPADGQMELDGMSTVGSRGMLDHYKWKREKLRYERESGELASKQEVCDGLAAGMAVLFGELDRVLASELPPELVGMREMEIRRRVRDAVEEAKEGFRNRIETLGQANELGEPKDEDERRDMADTDEAAAT